MRTVCVITSRHAYERNPLSTQVGALFWCPDLGSGATRPAPPLPTSTSTATHVMTLFEFVFSAHYLKLGVIPVSLVRKNKKNNLNLSLSIACVQAIQGKRSSGGAVFAGGGSNVTLAHTRFDANVAYGGALSVHGHATRVCVPIPACNDRHNITMAGRACVTIQ